MAKSSSVRSAGPARVRLVVLDAELPDGNIGTLANALQNALRSTAPSVIHRVAVENSPKTIAHQAVDSDDLNENTEDEVSDGGAEATPRASRARTPRKAPKAPDVVEIDMNSDVSFASFAAGKKIDSVHRKYLIAAAWLREHRGIPAVTYGHIYTCFRSIGWPTNIADFSQPLRELKTRKFFTTPEKGHYAINHLGLDYVNKKTDGD